MSAEAAVLVAPIRNLLPAKTSAGKLALVKADLTLSTNLDLDKDVPDFLQKSGPG